MAQPDALNARKLSDGTTGPFQICGWRLQQVRGTKMVLGTYDVMRLTDAEFSLRVRSCRMGPLDTSRSVAGDFSKSAGRRWSWAPTT